MLSFHSPEDWPQAAENIVFIVACLIAWIAWMKWGDHS